VRQGDLIYLSHADILRCALTADEITGAVEEGFRAKARDRAATCRRLNLPAGPQASFTAKAGTLLDQGYAAVKWYGYIGDNARRGLPDFSPLLVLSSIETGLPLAVMDGRWITAVRTASITAAAATVLAKPDSSSVGFVACGAQAEANLSALKARFPLRRAVAYSRNRDTAERFAAKARGLGLAADVALDASDAVRGLDIVVTSVPNLGAHPLPEGPRCERRHLRVDGRHGIRMGRGDFGCLRHLGHRRSREGRAPIGRKPEL